MTRLSFIIPAYNEAASLPRAIASIRRFVPAQVPYEIIVVDNGSTDGTPGIAERLGARCYVEPSGTVAHVRNVGASHATGSVFVFLDADTVLTETWSRNLEPALTTLSEQPLTVTGSRCSISEQPSWIERYWFKPLISAPARYINSAHLITTRRLFEQIKGFDPSLETGEDFDFSMRAKRAGAHLLNDPGLLAVHEGYPRTLPAFIRREAWHGTSDFTSLYAIARSGVAMTTLLFIALHVFMVHDLFDVHVKSRSLLDAATIGVMCLAAAVRKYHGQPADVLLVNTVLYYFYYWGRSTSAFKALFHRLFRRRTAPRSRPLFDEEDQNRQS